MKENTVAIGTNGKGNIRVLVGIDNRIESADLTISEARELIRDIQRNIEFARSECCSMSNGHTQKYTGKTRFHLLRDK